MEWPNKPNMVEKVARRRSRRRVQVEQEEGEEWEQVYQSAEWENPCLLASTLESWAPWVARKFSISPCSV